MNTFSRSLAGTLARRFLRTPRLLATSGVGLIVAALLMAAFVIMHAQSLSPAQVVERDLGRYQAYAGFSSLEVPPGSSLRERLLHDVTPMSGPNSNVALISNGFASLDLGTGSITLTEADWSNRPFKGLVLKSGHWPRRPGEVALVNPDSDHDATTIRAYGGQVKLTVVGRVRDLYARRPALIAAPGTWESIPMGLAAANPVLRAQPVLYWDGRNAKAVLDKLSQSMTAAAARQHEAVSQKVMARRIQRSFATRDEVAAQTGKSWIEKSPAAYLLPSVILPPMAALVFIALNREWMTRARHVMIAVGMDARTTVLGLWLAGLVMFIGAILAGIAIGWALGTLTAVLVSHWFHTPRPELGFSLSQAARPVTLSLLAGLAVLPVLMKEARTPPKRRPRLSFLGIRRIRRYGAALVAAGTCGMIPGLSSAGEAMVFTAGALLVLVLMLPDVLPAVLELVPQPSARSRLAVRQLQIDLSRPLALVALLTVLIGLSCSFTILLNTMVRTAGSQTYPKVLRGQVMLADRFTDLVPPPKAVLATAAAQPGLRSQRPLVLGYLVTVDRQGAELARTRIKGSDDLLMAMASPTAVERLTGVGLSGHQRHVLINGGALVWDQAEDAHELELRGPRSQRWITLPTANLEVPPVVWRIGRFGVVLTNTAHHHGLSVSPGARMYTGVSPTQARAVVAALDANGIDHQMARVYQKPPPPIPPLALWLTLSVLVILTLVVTFGANRAHIGALRQKLAALVSIGLTPRWVRGVVFTQNVIIIGLSLLLGSTIGSISVLISASVIPHFVPSIPWTQVMALMIAVMLAAVVSTALSAHTIRPIERNQS